MASQSKTHVFLLPALIDDIKSSLAGYLALPELGTAQPQLIYIYICSVRERGPPLLWFKLENVRISAEL
jgi:hypothetical protein